MGMDIIFSSVLLINSSQTDYNKNLWEDTSQYLIKKGIIRYDNKYKLLGLSHKSCREAIL